MIVTKSKIHSVILCGLALVIAACGLRGVVASGDTPQGTGTATIGSTVPATSKATKIATARVPGLLPGQQIWKDGVSSLLFGTNDTEEWNDHNIETEPTIQQALRDAGFSLVRTFFEDNGSDDKIEQRIKTVENIGAQCLGVIGNLQNVTYNEHLVQYLGNRCMMYEFGNESDYNGMSIGEYLSLWNAQIPKLRQINPQAAFIGPVTYNKTGRDNFLQRFLAGVAVSHILPDAISFHWYPCWEDSEQGCLDKATSYADVTQEVREEIVSALGKDLPIGITEWNYDPANPPPSYGDDADFVTQFSTNAMKAMISAKVAFACQFDAASYSGYGRHDLFDVSNNQPRPQFYAIKALIAQYHTTG